MCDYRSTLLRKDKKTAEEERIIKGLEFQNNNRDPISEIFANDWVANFSTIRFGKSPVVVISFRKRKFLAKLSCFYMCCFRKFIIAYRKQIYREK